MQPIVIIGLTSRHAKRKFGPHYYGVLLFPPKKSAQQPTENENQNNQNNFTCLSYIFGGVRGAVRACCLRILWFSLKCFQIINIFHHLYTLILIKQQMLGWEKQLKFLYLGQISTVGFTSQTTRN
jgi:hypothetical protein